VNAASTRTPNGRPNSSRKKNPKTAHAILCDLRVYSSTAASRHAREQDAEAGEQRQRKGHPRVHAEFIQVLVVVVLCRGRHIASRYHVHAEERSWRTPALIPR